MIAKNEVAGTLSKHQRELALLALRLANLIARYREAPALVLALGGDGALYEDGWERPTAWQSHLSRRLSGLLDEIADMADSLERFVGGER
jgi:hypothetical protein